MENKYYTPKIEEFHVGFEYETIYLKSVWTKEVLYQMDCGWFFESYINDAVEIEFRVKHLDKEDIESLGWEYSVLAKRYFLKSVGLDNDEINSGKGIWLFHTGIIESEIPHRWVIVDCRYALHQIRFDGKIKNKSELKKLMQMLNIE